MRRMLAAALVAAVMGMFAGSAIAADYRLLRLDGQIVKWGGPGFGSGATLTYALASRRMTFPEAINCGQIQPLKAMLVRSEIALHEFESELAAAFRAWERVANIRFRRVEDPSSANIVIGEQVKSRGRAFANVAYKKNSAASNMREISKSLVCFNPRQRWKIGFDGDDAIYDLRFTLMHEIGHAIGLDHEGSGDQLMGFAYHEAFREPQAGDIAGASLLYGPAPGAPNMAGGKPRDHVEAGAASGPGWPSLSLGRETHRQNAR